MAAHTQVGRVNLQIKPRRHNRLVFGGHGVCQSAQILFMACVIVVRLKHRNHAGAGAVHKGFFGALRVARRF